MEGLRRGEGAMLHLLDAPAAVGGGGARPCGSARLAVDIDYRVLYRVGAQGLEEPRLSSEVVSRK